MQSVELDFYRDVDDNACVEVSAWRNGRRFTAVPVRAYAAIVEEARRANVHPRVRLGRCWDYLGRGTPPRCEKTLTDRLKVPASSKLQIRSLLADAWAFEPSQEATEKLKTIQHKLQQIQAYRGYRRRCRRYRRAGVVQDAFPVQPHNFHLTFDNMGSINDNYDYTSLEFESQLRYVPRLDLHALVTAFRALWEHKKTVLDKAGIELPPPQTHAAPGRMVVGTSDCEEEVEEAFTDDEEVADLRRTSPACHRRLATGSSAILVAMDRVQLMLQSRGMVLKYLPALDAVTVSMAHLATEDRRGKHDGDLPAAILWRDHVLTSSRAEGPVSGLMDVVRFARRFEPAAAQLVRRASRVAVACRCPKDLALLLDERQTHCMACGGELSSEASKRRQLGDRCARMFPPDVASYLAQIAVDDADVVSVQDSSDSPDALHVPRKVFEQSEYCKQHGMCSQPATPPAPRVMTTEQLKMLDFVLRADEAPRKFFCYVMGRMDEGALTKGADFMAMSPAFDASWDRLSRAWSESCVGVPSSCVRNHFAKALVEWRRRDCKVETKGKVKTKASIKKRKLPTAIFASSVASS